MTIQHTTAALAAHAAAMVPAITVNPVPIPGMEDPLQKIAGMLMWGGLGVALLAVIAGLAGICATVFTGWHMSKKLIAGIFIALAGGVVISGVNAFVAGYIKI